MPRTGGFPMASCIQPVIYREILTKTGEFPTTKLIVRQGLACIMVMPYYTWYRRGDETGTAPAVGRGQCSGPRRSSGPRRDLYNSRWPVGCFIPSEWVLHRRLAAPSTSRQY